MNAQKLAEAVVHWTSFETLCARESLLSEISLRLPIGQFLMGSQNHDVIPEKPLPGQTGKKPKCFDYALKRHGADTLVSVLEAKWVNKEARPSFVDELFDDIYRLASLEWPTQQEPCDRFLVVAGVEKWIKHGIWERELNNSGGTRVSAFNAWLDSAVNGTKLNRIYEVNKTPRQPWAGKWRVSAEELKKDSLLSSIKTKLVGKYPTHPPDDGLVAYVWRVSAPAGAGTRKIADLFPVPVAPAVQAAAVV